LLAPPLGLLSGDCPHIDPPEADFIVGKIAELCADPRYDGKSFGVISLLGDAQAQLIQGKLIDG
jgi:hypothetical protein